MFKEGAGNSAARREERRSGRARKQLRQLFIGGRNDKAFGFEGRRDEAAIYNRALPAKEIAEHFAAAKP